MAKHHDMIPARPVDCERLFSHWQASWRAAYGLGIYLPRFGLTSLALRHLGELCHWGDPLCWMESTPGLLGLAGGVALCRQMLPGTSAPRPKRGPSRKSKEIILNGMTYDQVALVCNILILGGIRSGKTSGTLDWATDQLLKEFNDPGDELGGFFLDVKGNRTTRVLKFAHDAGRDVIKSCKVIRPNCALPFVKLQDVATKYFFYVPAVEFSTGSEAARLLAGALNGDTGDPIPANLFSWPLEQIESYEPMLKNIELDLTNRDVRFIGWRREGNELVRVNRTIGPHMQTEFHELAGRKLRIPYPTKLRYLGVSYIDNGLHYNIVNNRIEPAEAARRLRLIGQLLNNGKAGGDNKFWDDGAENHVLYCIEMLRIVNEEGAQVVGTDIAALTTQKTFWTEKNNILKRKIEELKKQITGTTDQGLVPQLEERLKKYTGIKSYFEEEWVIMEGKTKAIMTQVIKQLFNAFLLDGKLQKSMGSAATYSFMSTITKGDLYIFGGCEYETLAKMLGTALKMDFQSCVLSRPANKHINQTRYLLFENDECQEFAVSGVGSAVGDDRTMSLAGESLLINLLATQTLASLDAVMGKDRTRIYVGACGGIICYQVTDHGTAEEISKKIPEITREERELSSSDLRVTNLLSPDAKLKEHIRFVKEARFTANDFMTLNIREWESIAFNKTMMGDHAKAHRQTNLPHPVGSPEGKRELEEFMRWYECASIEHLAWEQKTPEMFSHLSLSRPVTATGEAAPPPAKPVENPKPETPVFIPNAAPHDKITLEFRKPALEALRKSIPLPPAPPPPIKPEETRKPSQPSAGADSQPNPQGPPSGSAHSDGQGEIPGVIEHLDSESRPACTGLDLERYRVLYANPAVIADLARKLTAAIGLNLETTYHEFLESKASGNDDNERATHAGPRGLVTGNLRARKEPLPAPEMSFSDEQRRLTELKTRMDELEAIKKKAGETLQISDEALDGIADDSSPDPNMLKNILDEQI
jgi:hypothetical protein